MLKLKRGRASGRRDLTSCYWETSDEKWMFLRAGSRNCWVMAAVGIHEDPDYEARRSLLNQAGLADARFPTRADALRQLMLMLEETS